MQSVEEQFPKHERKKVFIFEFKNSKDKRIKVKNDFEMVNWIVTFADSRTSGSEVRSEMSFPIS